MSLIRIERDKPFACKWFKSLEWHKPWFTENHITDSFLTGSKYYSCIMKSYATWMFLFYWFNFETFDPIREKYSMKLNGLDMMRSKFNEILLHVILIITARRSSEIWMCLVIVCFTYFCDG